MTSILNSTPGDGRKGGGRGGVAERKKMRMDGERNEEREPRQKIV